MPFVVIRPARENGLTNGLSMNVDRHSPKTMDVNDTTQKAARLSFIDWMKAIGMLLIVYGHSAAGTHYFITDPIYVKQLGVAFFVFVMGFTLARESRPASFVIFSRVFPVFLYGFFFAVLMSVIGLWIRRDPAESNYLPLLLGINVGFNSFPANPTTWFIGTYFHLVVIGTLLIRHWKLSWLWLAAWIPVSVCIRAYLLAFELPYIAYMLLTNWMSVLLVGFLFGKRMSCVSTDGSDRKADWVFLLSLGACLFGVWPLMVSPMGFSNDFPFELIATASQPTTLLITSFFAETIYLLGTLFVFRLSLLLPWSHAIEVLARNSLFVFIVHMPLIYALHSYTGFFGNRHLTILVNILLYFVLPAIVGETFARLARISKLQRYVLKQLRTLGLVVH